MKTCWYMGVRAVARRKWLVLSAKTLIRSGRKVMFATCGLMVQDLPATKRELRLRDSLKIFFAI